MPKERTGYVFQDEQKRWFARLTYTDEAGARRNVKRRAENKTAAKETLKQLIRELEDHGERAIESTQMTFADLADYYEERYLGPAQYLEGRKISGQRSYRDSLMHLRVLRAQFNRRRLRELTSRSSKPSGSLQRPYKANSVRWRMCIARWQCCARCCGWRSAKAGSRAIRLRRASR